ncbi:aldolase/citrate lyase family protein [Pseudophaeobacter arcticus]|uniref:aldolase/citrate lyase family protein n=1 Tax=Pseudophaeobacter arcticus TaxID=385492 RepID=UPI003CD0D45C
MSFRLQPTAPARPNRCQLFGPGSNTKLFLKMAASAADVINLDLEDSVAPSDKDSARANVIEALNTVDWGNKYMSVRINGLDTQWGADDATAQQAIATLKLITEKVAHVGPLGSGQVMKTINNSMLQVYFAGLTAPSLMGQHKAIALILGGNLIFGGVAGQIVALARRRVLDAHMFIGILHVGQHRPQMLRNF